jgi:tetratricopeptide (TPR) repeat protein
VPADRWQIATDFVDALEAAVKAPDSAAYLPVREQARRRWWTVGVAAAAAVGVAAALAVWRPWSPSVPLDPHKVMGFPLRAAGGVAREVTEQVFTVIENALVSTDPLKWVPGERYLSAGAAERGEVEVVTASRAARGQGARYWVTGTVSQAGDSLSVALELYDVRGDSLVAREPVTALASVPAYTLALRAMNALLPRLVGRSTHVDQVLLERFAPRAVVHWLAGEQAYREARYDSALSHYEQALALDSGMAFAALKGAMASAWSLDAEGYGEAASLVRLALAHESRLPRRNAAFAHGLAFLFEGDGDSAVAWFQRAVTADSGWSEAWYGVGEAYLHLAPSGTGQDSLARAAFERALSLDPDFAPVAFHLAEIALLAGDFGAADTLMGRHARLSRDSAQLVTLGILRSCIRSGPGAVAWRGLAERYPDEVLDVGRLLAGGARYPRCARAALEAALLSTAPMPDDGRQWSSAVGLHHLAIALGDTSRARRFVDSLSASTGSLRVSGGAFRVLDAVAGVMPDAWVGTAMVYLTVPVATAGPGYLPWIGAWAKHRGPLPRLDSIAAGQSALVQASGSVADRMAAEALAAWAALWRADTAAALARFGALRPVGTVGDLAFDFWRPLALERMAYARLLLARRQYARAIEVAGSFDRGLSLVDLVFLPASLELRRDAAQRLGRRDQVSRFRERLAALARSSS